MCSVEDWCAFDVFMITIMTVFSLLFLSEMNEKKNCNHQADENSMEKYRLICHIYFVINGRACISHLMYSRDSSFEYAFTTNLAYLLVNSTRKIYGFFLLLRSFNK